MKKKFNYPKDCKDCFTCEHMTLLTHRCKFKYRVLKERIRGVDLDFLPL